MKQLFEVMPNVQMGSAEEALKYFFDQTHKPFIDPAEVAERGSQTATQFDSNGPVAGSEKQDNLEKKENSGVPATTSVVAATATSAACAPVDNELASGIVDDELDAGTVSDELDAETVSDELDAETVSDELVTDTVEDDGISDSQDNLSPSSSSDDTPEAS
ncbi:unnamed protein product [Ambrosiozyma monospora]|uniref:Unnamed protein product n=1 Tax=Ambrosiozyma monospora TaxID=43982 RepID=A0A9W6Z551_AMBMO|nr:unnamed protein product [Ambrosiozyma monospora]